MSVKAQVRVGVDEKSGSARYVVDVRFEGLRRRPVVYIGCIYFCTRRTLFIDQKHYAAVARGFSLSLHRQDSHERWRCSFAAE